MLAAMVIAAGVALLDREHRMRATQLPAWASMSASRQNAFDNPNGRE
jgi:hypothetical protein